MQDIHPYKVVRLLDRFMPRAVKPTKAGVRMDCRLYFREKPNGDLWAEVVLVNPESGQPVNSSPGDTIPLEGAGVIPWYFGEIATRGFAMARERRTGARH